ncbi:MFS transporter [Thermoleophilia bacterium SCSIO 60948]|nr:MFS transporter [Thermoleophilia bacterium SCSIO 60948]
MRRLFALASAAIVLDVMFFSAITPLLGDYQRALGLSKTEAGILSASYAAGTLIGALPSGWLAARVGVRPTLLIGLGLISASCVTFGFARDIVLLDAARFAQGFGGACTWAGALAWLIAGSPRDRRGELLGGALGLAIAGALVGPVIGAAAERVGTELVFSVVAVLAIALAVLALRIDPVRPTPPPGWRAVGRSIADRSVLGPVWLVALPAMLSGTINVLGPLRFEELGASAVGVAAVFVVAAGIEAAASRFFGGVSDRRGRFATMRPGMLGATVGAAALGFPDSIALLAVVLVLAFVSLAAFWAPAMAMLSDSAEATGLDLGFAFALVNAAWAGGQVVGGSAGSSLADATSDAVPYLIIAALFAITALAFRRFAGRRDRPSGELEIGALDPAATPVRR